MFRRNNSRGTIIIIIIELNKILITDLPLKKILPIIVSLLLFRRMVIIVFVVDDRNWKNIFSRVTDVVKISESK